MRHREWTPRLGGGGLCGSFPGDVKNDASQRSTTIESTRQPAQELKRGGQAQEPASAWASGGLLCLFILSLAKGGLSACKIYTPRVHKNGNTGKNSGETRNDLLAARKKSAPLTSWSRSDKGGDPPPPVPRACGAPTR